MERALLESFVVFVRFLSNNSLNFSKKNKFPHLFIHQNRGMEPESRRFKDITTFEERRKQAEEIRKTNPDKIPIICEKQKGSKLECIDKSK